MDPPPLPPPIPNHPSANARARAHFLKDASWASLLAPVAGIFVIGVRQAVTAGAASQTVYLVTGWTCFALVAGGFLLGLIILFRAKQAASGATLGRGIAGTVINALLLALIATGAIERNKEEKMLGEMAKTAKEFNDNSRKSFNSTNGLTNTDFKSLDRMQSQLSNASQTLSGDNGIVARVVSDYLGRTSDLMKTYHARVGELKEAKVLSVSNLTSLDQISTRRQIVENFLEATHDVKEFEARATENLRSNLVSAGVSDRATQATMTGFETKFAPRRELKIKIRECDERIGKSELAVLGILETNWGKWRYDKATQKIIFQQTAMVKAYQGAMAEIRQASKDQVDAQGKLLNMQGQ